MCQRSRSMVLLGCMPGAALLIVSSAAADWVDFVDETAARLVVTSDSPLVAGSPDALAETANDEQDLYCDYFGPDETHFGCVLVAKQLGTNGGKRRNWLFMRENGQLVDRTAEFASTSDVPDDLGFYTPTADRDVVIADVTGDGWKVITAVTLSGSNNGGPGDKKISHPRVYLNLGDDGNGNWLGLNYDDVDRVPTMPAEPRFCSVSAGDIDNDGDTDLYFSDNQYGGERPVDLNDRLWINDGTGYFTDESALRMTLEMLESSFAMATVIADVNNDGRLDILKDDANNVPQVVSVSYNNLDGSGTVGIFDSYQLATPSIDPYHINTGDANGDGFLDIVVTRDSRDSVLINTGLNASGQATWQDVSIEDSIGGDFGGNNLFVDLDQDGRDDVIITSMDVDLINPGDRGYIYHTTPCAGAHCIPSFEYEGDCGISVAHYQGSNDAINLDINGDSWDDLFICSTSGGCAVYVNQPPLGLVFSYPLGIPSMIEPDTAVEIQVHAEPFGGFLPDPSGTVMVLSINGGPASDIPMTPLGGNTWSVDLPAGNCSDLYAYTFGVEDLGGGGSVTDPVQQSTAVSFAFENILTEGFEADTSAWTVSSVNLVSGAWEVAVPIGTFSGGALSQPDDDAEAGGTRAFVTQNCPTEGACGNHAANSSDVDGGPTDLISPQIDLDGLDGVISYDRWFFSNDAGGAEADVLIVSVSNDDGINWVDVEVVSESASTWEAASFTVGNYVAPSTQVRVRFRVADEPNNSVTNAGVDAFVVDRVACDECTAGCDDGNPCTIDACVDGENCGYTNTGGACDDGNACTENDGCQGGVCGGSTVTCDDGNICTDDSCDPASGCVFDSAVDCSGLGDPCNIVSCDPAGPVGNCDILTPLDDGDSCDDGDPCMVGETCAAGVCSGGASVDCSGAGDQCNTASCSAGGAEGNCDALTPIGDGTACDDGDPCSVGESCQTGSCSGGDAPDCSGVGDECNVASCSGSGSDGNCDVLEPVDDGEPCDAGTGVCVAGACMDACTTLADCSDLDGDGIRDNSCIWWWCDAGLCSSIDVVFADIGGQFGSCPPDGSADGNDRFLALTCFAGQGWNHSECEPDPPNATNLDAGGPFGSCSPDGVCDGNDAFHALNAFAGLNSCSCPRSPSPEFPPTVVDWSTIRLEAAVDEVRAGQVIHVDVYMEQPLSDLRGYQLHVTAAGRHSGALTLVDMSIRDVKAEHVFEGLAFWEAYNVKTGQLVVGLDTEGVDTPADGYLATLTYRVSKNASGTFLIDVLHDHDDPTARTFIFPTLPTGMIEVSGTTAAVIEVVDGETRRGR